MVIISGGMLPLLRLRRCTTIGRRPLAGGGSSPVGPPPRPAMAQEREMEREREGEGGKRREEQMGEDGTMHGCFLHMFANKV